MGHSEEPFVFVGLGRVGLPARVTGMTPREATAQPAAGPRASLSAGIWESPALDTPAGTSTVRWF